MDGYIEIVVDCCSIEEDRASTATLVSTSRRRRATNAMLFIRVENGIFVGTKFLKRARREEKDTVF
jgi:hypothetical protein